MRRAAVVRTSKPKATSPPRPALGVAFQLVTYLVTPPSFTATATTTVDLHAPVVQSLHDRICQLGRRTVCRGRLLLSYPSPAVFSIRPHKFTSLSAGTPTHPSFGVRAQGGALQTREAPTIQ